ncbi:hypothetical protein TNCV_2729251 [Trichonephila clavipes]|nr:hypothetical protein TNCV_2729251 [Trichonephila clavipes]
MEECARRTVSTKVQVACRRATKSVCVVTTSRYINSLRLLHKNSNGVRSGYHGHHRTGRHVLSSFRSTLYRANHVQEYRNLPVPIMHQHSSPFNVFFSLTMDRKGADLWAMDFQ